MNLTPMMGDEIIFFHRAAREAASASEPQRMRGLLKAQALLVKRGILTSLRSLELSATYTQQYWDHLLTLQAAIFDLDYYGEENWVIEKSVLDHHWQHIEAAAERLAHKDTVTPWLEPIRSYQQIELGI